MWFLWLYLSAIFGTLHGAIPDIGCGQSTVSIAPEGEIVYFRLINNRIQDVSLQSNTSVVSGSMLKIKDSKGRYIESVITTQCDEEECHETVFTMQVLPRGVYTVEMIVGEYGGDFKVDMICTPNGTDKWNAFEGNGTDVHCGQSIGGTITGDETISFQFTNDHTRDVILVDTNNSFVPKVTIQDAAGRYIESGFTTDCNGEDCDGNAFMVKGLSPGLYHVELTGNQIGEFKVDMTCSNDSDDVKARGTTPSARSRRLRSVFNDWAIDEWINNLDDVDIDYFYNLMINGQMDDIMDAFRYDIEYDDYGEYQVDGRYYDDYDYDTNGGTNPFVMTVPVHKSRMTQTLDAFPQEWMGYLSDNIRLNEINIPGTHDTMTYASEAGAGLWAFGPKMSQCQAYDFEAQLNNGIRYFDMRMKYVGQQNKIQQKVWDESDHDIRRRFKFFHGPTGPSVHTLLDVWQMAHRFLTAHPSEVILLRLKDEQTGSKTFLEALQKLFNLFKSDGDASWVYWPGTFFMHPDNVIETIPLLGETRHKMVILIDHASVPPKAGEKEWSDWQNYKEYTLGLGKIKGVEKGYGNSFKATWYSDVDLRRFRFRDDWNSAKECFTDGGESRTRALTSHFVRVQGNTYTSPTLTGPTYTFIREWALWLNSYMIQEMSKIADSSKAAKFGIVTFDFPEANDRYYFQDMVKVMALTNPSIWGPEQADSAGNKIKVPMKSTVEEPLKVKVAYYQSMSLPSRQDCEKLK